MDDNKTKIKFLGSGDAFALAKDNYQSNILITRKDKHLLYDAGSTIAEALNSYNMKPQDLDSIYISHLHDDHAGGIEYISFKTFFEVFQFGKTEFGSMKPNLFGHYKILENGWSDCWQGGLKSIQGQTNTLETYFNTNYLKDSDSFDFYGLKVEPVQTVHVFSDREIVPSYGIIFGDDKKCFITGDTQFSPNSIHTFYDQADIIFQDCEFKEYNNSVHAQFHQLCTLNDNTKAKMWLYHYSSGDGTLEELEDKALMMGFAGLVKRGQEFII